MTDDGAHPPASGAGRTLVDDFPGPALRRDLWVAQYLPHWTTPDRSAARYAFVAEGLQLRIEEDQLDWRPEDAPLRVSNLQTGVHSGPEGSARGTHRHRPDGLVVRTATGTRLAWAPSAGRLSVRVSAGAGTGCMLAAWLVGTEHRSEDDAGEICIFEVDASAIGPVSTTARSGIKAHHDPRLRDDMAEVRLPFRADRPHTWTVTWGSGTTVIGCEGAVVRTLDQAPDYPLFLMLDLFEIGPRGGVYPKTALIHHVEGHAESP
ncbi:MAG TPA: hypothetical protein VGC94_04425 [Amnibacterium sp.]